MNLCTTKRVLYLHLLLLITSFSLFCYTLLTQNPYCAEMAGVFIAVLAEVGTFCGFYANKSKKENSLKIAYGMIDKLGDKYGIENVTAIFDIVNRQS